MVIIDTPIFTRRIQTTLSDDELTKENADEKKNLLMSFSKA
jgi:hypothetical protein